MNDTFLGEREDRRSFLKEAALYGSVLTLGGYASKFGNFPVEAESPADWAGQIGIQITVLRAETAKDFDGTLAKLAEIGYKTWGPVGFSGMDPKQYRAMLDSHGLSAPWIDQGFSTGPDMEKDLEACQILGIKYAEPVSFTSVLAAGRGRGPGAPGGPGGGQGLGGPVAGGRG